MRPFALTRRSKVSIHAPTRGATFVPFSNVVIYDCFNPRTHTGCDLLSGGLSTQAIVSIHAPTRGATTAILAISESGSLFQSTHPHGVRQCINTTYVRVACFNPRTHTGCDIYNISRLVWYRVSIHAPTRGATDLLSFSLSSQAMFQSTHPHGVRRLDSIVSGVSLCFNPRTHTGCDFPLFNWDKSKKGFNPRTHTGCDLKEHISINRIRIVSIHAPTRGAT